MEYPRQDLNLRFFLLSSRNEIALEPAPAAIEAKTMGAAGSQVECDQVEAAEHGHDGVLVDELPASLGVLGALVVIELAIRTSEKWQSAPKMW